MFQTMKKLRDRQANDEGFSLIELIITVAIIAILAAVAIPIFLNQRSKAQQSVAVQDGNTVASEVATALASYTNMGTAPVANTTFITHSGTTLTLTFNGSPAPAGASVALAGVRLTSGTTITASGYTGGAVTSSGPTWCFIASNNSQTAVYNQSGYQPTATACSNAGATS